MSVVVNIYAPTNGDFRRVFYVLNDQGKVRDDIYQSTLLMHVRDNPASELIRLQAGTDPEVGGMQFMAPLSSGLFVILFHWLDLKNLGAGEYYHDLLEIKPSGFRSPLWSGKFILNTGVTR